jgi:hypothetical protein
LPKGYGRAAQRSGGIGRVIVICDQTLCRRTASHTL